MDFSRTIVLDLKRYGEYNSSVKERMMIMKDIPKASFVCTGENALELSGSICCAGKLIKILRHSGYMTGGCYSCISPKSCVDSLRERIRDMTKCCDLVVTIGSEGFKNSDVLPEITQSLSDRQAPFFAYWLSAGDTNDKGAGKTSNLVDEDFVFPSRATAAFCNNALIINMPSDPAVARKRICALLPSISYALGTKVGTDENGLFNAEKIVSDYLRNKSL